LKANFVSASLSNFQHLFLSKEPEEHEDFSDGIYISKIVENGAAEKAGLHVHDRIIEVCQWCGFVDFMGAKCIL